MILQTVIAWDAPDSAEARATHRDDHFAYINTIVDKIAVAGPLKDAWGSNIGSLLVYRVETREEAESLFRNDPYFKADVWDRWTLHPFLAAAGEWVGGTTW